MARVQCRARLATCGWSRPSRLGLKPPGYVIWARVSLLTSQWGFQNHTRPLFLSSQSRIHAALSPATLALIALRFYRKGEARDR